ncbi:MAG: transglycosylase domain-containing protein, partial [Alphaproteobacteria bacterium]
FFLSENMYKSSDRSFRRKIQELLFSLWLEYKFSKKQILSMYLNRVYLGSGVYGIEAAAHKYFGKRAKHLTLYESAVIAGLLKAPSRFSPTSDPDRANQRAQTVLVAMVDAGFISHKRRASLKSSRARMRTAHEKAHVGRYFVDWIIDSLPNYIGKVDRDIVVKTTFDPKLQRHAEREARKVVSQYRKEKKVSQVAVLSMSTDGAVRAMVGGMDYGKSKFNRAVQAMRQSGSIFKIFPFLAALENGYDRKTRVSDGAIKIGSWKPKNYLWRTRGDLSLQDTFAYSVNTGTVRVSKKLGLKKIKRVAHRLGITQPLPNDLTIVLGTGNVTLLQLTASVATVANGGRGVWPYGIVEIRDRKGKILYRRKKSGGNRVLSQTTANQMAHMLNAVMQYGTGKSASISAGCCGKTGTTQNYVDAWIVGYADNPRLVTGVWLGNDNNKPMKKVTGGSLPGKVWKNYMSAARKK